MMKLLSCFYDNNEDSCQPKGPTVTTEYKSTLIWLLCDFCKDCGTVKDNIEKGEKGISCCLEEDKKEKEEATANTCTVSSTDAQTSCGTSDKASCDTTQSVENTSCTPPTPTATPTPQSTVQSTESTNCKLKELENKLSSANCEVLTKIKDEIKTNGNNCPCTSSDNKNKIKNFVEKSMENCKKEAKELIDKVNAQVIDTRSYEEMEPYIKEFSLRILCLLLYKRIVEELILLHNFLESIIGNLSTCYEIKSCTCGDGTRCCSTKGKCLCSIYYKLCHVSITLHNRYCKIIKYMKGESDEDLYKTIPSLSLTRSIYLLTKYFNEYICKIDEESNCATQPGAANGKCMCHKYSSKLDEILTSLCETIEDDTSDDILSNVIQFISYVVKDEFSDGKKFEYKTVHEEIKKKEFDKTLGCCCCTKDSNRKCCCKKEDGKTCTCGKDGGQCCQGDNCCCKDKCCCLKAIDINNGQVEIKLCDCCCTHKNGKCTANCTQVTDKKCYCCCLCEDATCSKCETAASDTSSTGLIKCCCKSCGTTGSACCEKCKDCKCECKDNIKLCDCCKCFTQDKIISCCELESKSDACKPGECCCCKDCGCNSFNSNDCNNSNGTAADSCGNNTGEYCCDEKNAACTLDICKISCCMSNLTKKGSSSGSKVCLSDIVKDMKNFSKYLGKVKDCNGKNNCTCTCPKDKDCCCKDENGKCCDMYCVVKNMFTQIFSTCTEEKGNGKHNGKESICQGTDKCIFCILCCLKDKASKIQDNYKECKDAECCTGISTTCGNTSGTNGCQTASDGTSTCETNGCTPPTTATGTCQCSTICPGCNGEKCCDSDSSCSIYEMPSVNDDDDYEISDEFLEKLTREYADIEHPLFMDEIPNDISSNEDLEALYKLLAEGETRDSIALKYKDVGNGYVNDGKRFYDAAISSYTNGIQAECKDNLLNSQLYSNRAYVYLKLGQYVKCIDDCKRSIKFNKHNYKAYYRGSLASFNISLYKQSLLFCVECIKTITNSNDINSNVLYNVDEEFGKLYLKVTKKLKEFEKEKEIQNNKLNLLQKKVC